MTLDITFANGVAADNGPLTDITSFSVQEDATPTEPSSSFGGVGAINFSALDNDSLLWMGGVTLVNGEKGSTSGTVIGVSITDGIASVQANSVLGLFNTEKTVSPFIGTFGNAIQHYCDLVGIPNEVQVQASLSSRSVTYPGWKGNIWVFLKQILVREQAEISLIYNRIQVRSLHRLVAYLDRSKSITSSINTGNAAQSIEIAYYNHSYGDQVEIYPDNNEDATIYSVDAGEVQTIDIPVNASIVSVNQPVATDFVNNTSYAGTNGVYAVIGSDNLPITAAQWNAQGGKVTVSTTDDPSIIRVTVTGAFDTTYAPYRIAMSDGSNEFNSLHITGTAITFDRQTLTLPTGTSTLTTSDAAAPQIDNIFVSTLEEAFNLGLKAAQANAGLNYQISGEVLGLNRTGGNTGILVPLISDFNTANTGNSIADFNTEWSGQSIAEFNTYWQLQYDELFDNQMFGNAPGARVEYSDAMFRINTTITTDSTVSFTASIDTLVSDFNTVWDGMTIADFNTEFANSSIRDFSIRPLRRTV